MTEFYEVSDEQGKAQWLVAHEGAGDDRIFAWLPNTGEWHRNAALEDAFYALTPDMTFRPLEPHEAARKVSTWPKLNRKRVGWLIDELAMAPSKTSSQLSLPRSFVPRPVTNGHVAADLEKSRAWIVVRRYPVSEIKAARSLASTLRQGKRKTLARLGVLDVRARVEGNEAFVEAKLTGRVDHVAAIKRVSAIKRAGTIKRVSAIKRAGTVKRANVVKRATDRQKRDI